MTNVLGRELQRYSRRHKRRRDLFTVFLCLVLVVNLAVTWSLKQTGFTLEGDPTENSAYSGIDISKTIDHLDGDNPDTDLTGDDFYRLYLDLESTESDAGIDLLIVVDQSGTMFENADITYNNTSMYRDCVVSNILNGSATVSGRYKPNEGYNRYEYQLQVHGQVTKDSLINKFLELDSRNKVAVIGFSGDRNNSLGNGMYNPSYPAYARNGYSYQTDSTILLNWTNTAITNPVDTTAYCYTGTNYHAALLRANDMFSSSSVLNDGNVKVMIFFSDGVPTCYIASNGDRGGTTMSGTISQPEIQNILNCRPASQQAFEDFLDNFPDTLNPDPVCYSVGISNELNSDTSVPFSDTVLRNYVNVDGKGYYYSGNDGDQLRRDMMELAMKSATSNVSITDELSQYVQFYSADADVKVIETAPNGTKTVLYDDGITTAGQGIVKSVVYTPTTNQADLATTTGKIVATFEDNFVPKQGYKYTLSYNVALTQAAYDKLLKDGYGDTKGQSGTDFDDQNGTSSNQAGFRSNKEAHVEYKVGGKTHSNEDPDNVFKHPVVQASTMDVKTQKVWLNHDGTTDTSDHGAVTVQLYRKSTELGSSSNTPTPTASGPEGYETASGFETGKSYILWNTDTDQPVGKDISNGQYHSLVYDQSVDLSKSIPSNYVWTYGSDGQLSNDGDPVYIPTWTTTQTWSGSTSDYAETTAHYSDGKVYFTAGTKTIYLTHTYEGANTAASGDNYVLIPVDTVPGTNPAGWTTVSAFTAGEQYVLANTTSNVVAGKHSDTRDNSLEYVSGVTIDEDIADRFIWTYQTDGKLVNASGDELYVPIWASGPDNWQSFCNSRRDYYSSTTVSYVNGKIRLTNANNTSVYLTSDYHGTNSETTAHSYTLYEWHDGDADTYRARKASTPSPTPDPNADTPIGDPVTLNTTNSYAHTFEHLFKQGNVNGTIYQYTYYVREVTVPQGYVVSYEEGSNHTLYVKNTSTSTTPTPTPDPSVTPGETPTPDPTVTPGETPTPDPTETPTPIPTETPTPITSPTPTESPDLLSFSVKKVWEDDSGEINPIVPVSVQIYQVANPVGGSGDWVSTDTLVDGETYVLYSNESGYTGALYIDPWNDHSAIIYDNDVDMTETVDASYQWTYSGGYFSQKIYGDTYYIHATSGGTKASVTEKTQYTYDATTHLINSNSHPIGNGYYAGNGFPFTIYHQGGGSGGGGSGGGGSGATPTPFDPVPYGDSFELSSANDCEYRVKNVPISGTYNGVEVTYTYYAVELDSTGKGYEVTYSHDQDNPITDSGGTVTITNKIPGIWGYELPSAGGSGIKIYIWAGSVLTGASILFLLFRKKRERRKASG